MKPLILVMAPDANPRTAHVYHVDSLGSYELTRCVQAAHLHLDVLEGPGTVDLRCIIAGGTISAELDELVVRHVGPSRLGQRLWRLRKWWWGVRRP